MCVCACVCVSHLFSLAFSKLMLKSERLYKDMNVGLILASHFRADDTRNLWKKSNRLMDAGWFAPCSLLEKPTLSPNNSCQQGWLVWHPLPCRLSKFSVFPYKLVWFLSLSTAIFNILSETEDEWTENVYGVRREERNALGRSSRWPWHQSFLGTLWRLVLSSVSDVGTEENFERGRFCFRYVLSYQYLPSRLVPLKAFILSLVFIKKSHSRPITKF